MIAVYILPQKGYLTETFTTQILNLAKDTTYLAATLPAACIRHNTI